MYEDWKAYGEYEAHIDFSSRDGYLPIDADFYDKPQCDMIRKLHKTQKTIQQTSTVFECCILVGNKYKNIYISAKHEFIAILIQFILIVAPIILVFLFGFNVFTAIPQYFIVFLINDKLIKEQIPFLLPSPIELYAPMDIWIYCCCWWFGGYLPIWYIWQFAKFIEAIYSSKPKLVGAAYEKLINREYIKFGTDGKVEIL